MKKILLIAPDFHSEYFSKDFEITSILLTMELCLTEVCELQRILFLNR